MSIEKPSMVKRSAVLAIIWIVITLGCACLIAYFGRMVLAEELLTVGAQKMVFIEFARRLFPAFLAGILLAAIMAASMSTADSQLLVASSSFTSDLYKPLIRKNKASEKETLWVGRIVVLVVSAVAFWIASSGASWASNIMAMVENAWGLFGAAFGPVVILSLFWRRMNYAGACAGIIVGAVVDIAWLLCFTNTITDALILPTGVYEILPGFIVGAIATIVVSLLTKAPSAEVDAIFVTATDPKSEN